ncbi:MAG: Enolase [Candidatus Woesebacteria bacterium GW2011_GWA1_39_8]|uniref:Enolase n=1 Tax=Candidatus Woesebacteria bacterium GW2011_GWA1_39_8 TaxID=1618552 RepID=A0A0G0PRI5_9BACT|nr:MAG: Enolase [Candidatus Woesebacteria bacterium GW2011_GWA1_39_8]
MSSKISKVWARQILDSRGIPTVEAACQLDTGEISVASVPSGTSTGTHEALELRDNDPQNYLGKSVYKAVSNVNEILGPGVWGLDVEDQEKVDKRLIELDGTENKSKYGANAILSVSVVSVKAASLATRQPLYLWINTLAKRVGIKEEVKVPTPVFVMIEGGLHGAGNLDFQEFHIIPASSKKYSESLKIGVEIFLPQIFLLTQTLSRFYTIRLNKLHTRSAEMYFSAWTLHLVYFTKVANIQYAINPHPYLMTPS